MNVRAEMLVFFQEFFCSAEVIWTRSCAAANEKLQRNFEKAALQESGAFLPLSCGFQAPTFRHPRLGPADEVLGRDIRANDPRMSAGRPSRKLPLWADFWFLKNVCVYSIWDLSGTSYPSLSSLWEATLP